MSVSQQKVEEMWVETDEDESGSVEFGEFYNMLQKHFKSRTPDREIKGLSLGLRSLPERVERLGPPRRAKRVKKRAERLVETEL